MTTTQSDTTTARQRGSLSLGGVIPPMMSLLDEQGLTDTHGTARLVEHILGGGCSGLFILGGYGEGAWLTTTQRGATVRATVAAAQGRVPVLVGVMLPATWAACEAARQAEAEGADAIVAGSPYYFGVDSAAQRRHIEALLAACSLPLMLYNIPQCTHNLIAPETAAALARDPRVIGIKDSAEDKAAFRRFLEIREQRPAFRVLQGSGKLMAEASPLVGDGLVPGLANIAPHLYVTLFAAAKAGDAATIARTQEQLKDLATLEQFGYPIAAAKVALAALGFGSGTPALPFVKPDDAAQRAIAAIALRHQPVHAHS
jgi:4-hydroxy-tetrahydrodipicolinate synthase